MRIVPTVRQDRSETLADIDDGKDGIFQVADQYSEVTEVELRQSDRNQKPLAETAARSPRDAQ
ncbi:MAG: hypothetical protein ACJ0Q1_04730 [Luminiphilus sp.]